jgi:hypothetical protein
MIEYSFGTQLEFPKIWLNVNKAKQLRYGPEGIEFVYNVNP